MIICPGTKFPGLRIKSSYSMEEYEQKDKAKAIKRGERVMMNFSNNKTKKIISGVIIILLVLAMVVPTVMAALMV